MGQGPVGDPTPEDLNHVRECNIEDPGHQLELQDCSSVPPCVGTIGRLLSGCFHVDHPTCSIDLKFGYGIAMNEVIPKSIAGFLPAALQDMKT